MLLVRIFDVEKNFSDDIVELLIVLIVQLLVGCSLIFLFAFVLE